MKILTLVFTLLATAAQATPLARCIGLADTDTALIVNADDIGMHPDLDKAAFKLIDAGQIQDISLMAPTPNFEQAAKWAKARHLAVGVHLTLTNEWQDKQPWGGVLSPQEVPSLYNPQGRLWASTPELVAHAKPDEVKKELLAQITKVQAAGLEVTHLDAHMVFWGGNPQLMEIYLSLARETGIPVVLQSYFMPMAEQLKANRKMQSEADLATPDTFSMHYNPSQRQRGVAYQGYLNLIDDLPAGINTIAIHPAEDSPAAQKAIADLTLRLSDFTAWSSPETQQRISAKGIKKINYAPLQTLQAKIKQDPSKNCLE
jgi:predicted glycoside hydrolase/deacetylase ChbG (UPF0249 family)